MTLIAQCSLCKPKDLGSSPRTNVKASKACCCILGISTLGGRSKCIPGASWPVGITYLMSNPMLKKKKRDSACGKPRLPSGLQRYTACTCTHTRTMIAMAIQESMYINVVYVDAIDENFPDLKNISYPRHPWHQQCQILNCF